MEKPDILGVVASEGFQPKRKGKSYWISCPAHTDKTPSLKIDPERQSFYCFSCQTGSDSIGFIQMLYGMSFQEACRYLKINGSSHQPKVNPKEKTKRILLAEFRQWECDYHNALADFYRDLHLILKDCKTMEQVEEFTEDLRLVAIVEDRMEILFNGTDREKYELYREVNGNGNRI